MCGGGEGEEAEEGGQGVGHLQLQLVKILPVSVRYQLAASSRCFAHLCCRKCSILNQGGLHVTLLVGGNRLVRLSVIFGYQCADRDFENKCVCVRGSVAC